MFPSRGPLDLTSRLECRDSRDIIWRAKGKLMEQYQIDQVRAFAIVVCLSQGNDICPACLIIPTASVRWRISCSIVLRVLGRG
jgi:hypothetical protein